MNEKLRGKNNGMYKEIDTNICEKYIGGMSAKEIAEECGCSRPTIITKLKEFGIKIRNNSEAKLNHIDNHPEAREAARLKSLEQWSDPEAREADRLRSTEYWAIQSNRDKMLEIKSKEKDPLPDGKKNKLPTNKYCESYFGGIVEQILIKIFKDVKVMPYGNHGYDFICNKDYKIDAKGSFTGHKGSWKFRIEKNDIADFFLCLAFESREDLTNPAHLWLIPGKDVNHKTGIFINKSTLSKWSQYEQPLDKVIACCNEMKGD